MKTSLVTMVWVCGMAAAPAAMAAADAATERGKTGGATESLKVMRDAETGALRAPTAAESKAMEASSVKKAPAPVHVQVAPNGTKSVRLPAEYLISIEATRDANGNVSSRHQQHDMEHGVRAALPTE